ncbi:hypothetical protein V1523DRAFT_401806 [Lipomyces doorenjongii]
MDLPNYELVSYARAHGISTNHTEVTYWSRLNRSTVLPVQVLTTQWLCTRTPQYVFLHKDLQTGNEIIDYTDQFVNAEAIDFNAKDYVELETLPNVAVELMKMDEPELRGPAVKPYLERVAPFAYMGNMKVQDPEVEEEPIWISVKKFKFHFKEKLQITADVMHWLSKVTTQTEINTNKVFIYSSLNRCQYRFSSPLLPLEPERAPREPFEPTSELLTSIPESPLSRWSISEALSPASSLAPISTTASSPLMSRKRRVPMHFSSPVLPAAATAKRIKDIFSFPDDSPLEAAPPTAYSQVLQRRDCELASQMRQDAEITTSILQTENISEGDLALRVEVPVVVPLETAVQRRSRVKIGFPMTMEDIKGRVKEWRKGGNDWIIKWKPFEFAKEDVMAQQQGAECIGNGESDDMVIEMLTDNELEKMEDDAALQRSKTADWQLSDEVENDMEYLRFKEDEDSTRSPSNCPPKSSERVETLEDLLEYRKSTTHLTVDSNSDMRQVNKFLPVNPFELYTFDSTISDEKSTEDDPEERAQAEEKLREEKRHSDMIKAVQTHEAAIKSLGTTEFDPETKIIVNTTFLRMNRMIYCDILECTSGLIAIERDYGPEEADILLSSSCGLLVYSFSQILQRELDGTRVAVKRAKDIFQRIERLLILVRISPNISLKTQSDWTALADFMASLAGIRIFLVKDSENLDVVRWLINICQQFGGRGNGMADVETTV